MRSSVILEELRVELLLLRAERSKMRRFGHLVRRPTYRGRGHALNASPGRHPGPRTCWRDLVSWLTWERLGIPPEELDEVAGAEKDG